MRHQPPAATTRRRLTLVSDVSQATVPAPMLEDRLVRGTVIEEPYLDLMGRACFTAVNRHGIKIDEGMAASPKERERVLTRLWDAIDRSHERAPLELYRDRAIADN